MTIATTNMEEFGAATTAHRPVAGGWPSAEVQAWAHHEAAHAVICFLLYGQDVIREVALHGPRVAEPGLSTFSRLPIPIVCRPVGGEPRRGNPAPVSSNAIVDAHGILRYSGSAAEALLACWDGAPQALTDESARQRQNSDREALSKLSSLVRSERPEDVFYSEYWDEAIRLLRANWAAVEELAEALQRHGTLSGARVDHLLGAFLPS